jgi:hypothetical protein
MPTDLFNVSFIVGDLAEILEKHYIAIANIFSLGGCTVMLTMVPRFVFATNGTLLGVRVKFLRAARSSTRTTSLKEYFE